MIKSEFSIVKKVSIDKDFVNYHADEDEKFVVMFGGERVYFIKGKSPLDVYGRLLLCWTEQMTAFFIILKDNRIYNISDSDKKLIRYIAAHPSMFAEFVNIQDIITFSRL